MALGVYGATTIAGSIVLGLALAQGDLSPEAVLELIFLEENHKASLYDAEKYGPDPYIDQKKQEALKALTHAAGLIRANTTKESASSA